VDIFPGWLQWILPPYSFQGTLKYIVV
jgi:hypothetical protein